MSVITTERLTRRYGPRRGIEAVDLEVAEGRIFGFLGPNGAGKTTLIRVLLGFLAPTSGDARVLGRSCWRERHRIMHDVGYLPGDLRLYPWMTADAALAIFGRIRGRDLRTPGRRLAEQFDLDPRVRVRRMSRGMRQKLGLIMALAHAPRLVVLDEPTSGLDPLMQTRLAEHLREVAAAGRTVFFSSHTLSEVEQLCERVAIVREGKLVAHESLADLRGRAKRQVTLTFEDEKAAGATEVPAFLTPHDRFGATWQCDLTGDAPTLLRWAASQRLADIEIGPPDLESLFRKYYA